MHPVLRRIQQRPHPSYLRLTASGLSEDYLQRQARPKPPRQTAEAASNYLIAVREVPTQQRTLPRGKRSPRGRPRWLTGCSGTQRPMDGRGATSLSSASPASERTHTSGWCVSLPWPPFAFGCCLARLWFALSVMALSRGCRLKKMPGSMSERKAMLSR